MLMFAALYWICDVKGKTSWATLFRAAGSNTLLTYLLPDLWFFAMSAFGITWYDTHFVVGSPAVVKTIVFTIGMLLIAWAMTRARLRLQL